MDRVTAYESDKYKEQRLISFVNSPWDDPFVYDTLYNARFDTYNQVDMEHIGATAELLSGYFVSYRLETLCPDYQKYFTQAQRAELGELLTGLETGDLYSGYLTLLNRYYTVPIMATGFGFSTARTPVVENHSPLNEQQQGEALVELWQKMRSAGWTGGFVSTWQDVWDRNTWNTVYANYSFGVDNWQDVQTDGQNYGLAAAKGSAPWTATLRNGRAKSLSGHQMPWMCIWIMTKGICISMLMDFRRKQTFCTFPLIRRLKQAVLTGRKRRFPLKEAATSW